MVSRWNSKGNPCPWGWPKNGAQNGAPMKEKRGRNFDSIRAPIYDKPQTVSSLRQLSDMNRNRCMLSSESAVNTSNSDVGCSAEHKEQG